MRIGRHILFILLTVGSCVLSQPAVAVINRPVARSAQEHLLNGIASHEAQVTEFRFIKEQAEKMHIRAWLFGGTAAGYAHYVDWDLRRKMGDSRFQPDRFDYDYTNIYRSNQDLDIVIDGTAEQAQELQKILSQTFPHLQGNKTAWEVRLLTQDMGDKQALLNNPDYLNQHTDSNSTGMIELTHSNEPIVRDLRDWHSSTPYFLKDILTDQLHYYYSPLHETTTYYKQGRNPPIISVIRYLTKAFQYELKISPDDYAKIKSVINQFQPSQRENSYVVNWMIKNGKKLIQNAVNIEYAVEVLDQLGLRQKLMQYDDVQTPDSLAWWMNKEPLETYQLGTGYGKIAKALGLDIVAHETNNFLAYESITRAHTGDPNVFISRRGINGETAFYGNGFYTKIGKEGARGTGLTIRFHLNPNAREGSDFIFVQEHDFVVIKNKAALKVIPESLNFGIVEYFEFLKNDKISASDRGLLEKLKRRINNKVNTISQEDEQKLADIVRDSKSWVILLEWFSLKVSTKHPEVVRDLIQNGRFNREIARYILSTPQWSNHPELVEALLKKGTTDREIAICILSRPQWSNHPELVEALLKKGTADGEIAQYILSQPQWSNHPEWLKTLVERGTADWQLVAHVFYEPQWSDHAELLEALFKKTTMIDRSFVSLLSQPQWSNHPELVKALLKKGTVDKAIAQDILSQPQWSPYPELLETLIKRRTADGELEWYVLSKPYWEDNPQLKAICPKGKVNLKSLRAAFKRGFTFSKPQTSAPSHALGLSCHAVWLH